VPFAEVISTVPLSVPLVIFTSVGLKVGVVVVFAGAPKNSVCCSS
jgi:hypothetical protein